MRAADALTSAYSASSDSHPKVGGTSTDEFDFCTLLFGGSPLADPSRILARDSSHPVYDGPCKKFRSKDTVRD